MMPYPVHVALAGLLAFAAAPSGPADLAALLRAYPADSLVLPLRRFESEHGHELEGGEAALLLGRLHFARGEYRQAADAFARAGARLDPSRKQDARYWAGLSWLAMKEPNQARAALEEVEQSASSRRPEAMLGIALAWELAGRPDRAFDELERLLQRDPGEAGPAALERMSALTARLRRPDAAERARARLLREYPRSIEAAQAAAPEAEGSTPPAAGTLAVQIGVFSRPARAQTLAGAARRAGFSAAQVLTLGEGRARSYAVRLGLYPNAVEARKAGEEAARKLGVSYRVVSAP